MGSSPVSAMRYRSSTLAARANPMRDSASATGGLALPHVMQALDVAERVLERHAVGEQADVLLELLQRRLGMGAEVAVVGATCEAQDVQGLLQSADVGAMEVGETQVQRAIARVYRTRRPGLTNRGGRRRAPARARRRAGRPLRPRRWRGRMPAARAHRHRFRGRAAQGASARPRLRRPAFPQRSVPCEPFLFRHPGGGPGGQTC